jgi:hypothetical protein
MQPTSSLIRLRIKRVRHILPSSALILLLSCDADPEIEAPPCLTAEEADLYISLTQRQNEITEGMREGKVDASDWNELNSIAPRLGYLVNASNVRNTPTGCQSGWY